MHGVIIRKAQCKAAAMRKKTTVTIEMTTAMNSIPSRALMDKKSDIHRNKTMENAKPGHLVEFQGFYSASHLNGTRESFMKFVKQDQCWIVRCKFDYKQNCQCETPKLVR